MAVVQQAEAEPAWVGRAVCAGCHPAQDEAWQGSHHDLAMQPATPETVLGDFGGATFEHFGVTSTFSRRGGKFFVTTDGPDGAPAEYEISYTFGVEPLQQYLVRLDGGRLQALSLPWDARPASQGGQRWFHLHPDEPIPHDDVLHWTGPAQRWNFMCADCHSTGLRKGYDPARDRYETSWQELDVACEACHGPGSAHVAWAEAGASSEVADRGLQVRLRNEASWVFAPEAAIARREGPEPSGAELDVCAPCHSRRAAITENGTPGRPFLDGYRPALLDEGLYHADGQILDEVYVWGSFLQSRMHAEGVTCSDCHDPHSLRIEGDPRKPDVACASCHRAEVFAVPAHHRHEPGGAGSRCVDCHMPARDYMVIDARRDHGFRVPRPDLTERIGVPNACNGCHTDRSAAWAARTIVGWHGESRAAEPHWGEVLHAGRRQLPGAGRGLAELAGHLERPAIARATALRLLREQPGPVDADAIVGGLGDEDPLVRLGALEAAERLEPGVRLHHAGPLLRDPILAVRIAATETLIEVPPALWSPGERGALADALAEYRAAQHANADRTEAHLNLGVLHARFGELDEARREYETALRLGPDFLPAYLNLADLHRERGRDDEGERVLRRALERAPDDADVSHALGLLLVRQQRLPDAIAALGRAAEGAPERARYAYVYAVALHSTGETKQALAVLDAAHLRHPADRELLTALATISRDAGAADDARTYASRLLALDPADPRAQALAREVGELGDVP